MSNSLLKTIFYISVLPAFWSDCKLPDYEEVVGHPPTPPPPYSENPLETSSSMQPRVICLESPVVLEAPQTQNTASWSLEADPVVANAHLGCHEEEDTPCIPEEELNTRRRHVTGDSGIEMCVCQLDELEENEVGVCQMPRAGCCSVSQALVPKGSSCPTSTSDERLV